jgi:hypothetical protein
MLKIEKFFVKTNFAIFQPKFNILLPGMLTLSGGEGSGGIVD